MADEETVMPYTLRSVTRAWEEEAGVIDSLLDLAREVIREHHPDLADAEIAYLLRSGKDKAWWGMARRATEEGWILSGGVDLSVQVNGLLWGSHLLTTAGRKFLLDFLLSRFAVKTEGKTHMEVADGEERQLYKVERQDLLSLAALIARHPQGHAELAEVAAIRKAIEEPAQYLLDLQEADGGGEDEEDKDEDEPAEAPTAKPVYYYQPRFVDLGHGVHKATLQYSNPAMAPEHLVGVCHHPEQAAKPGLPAIVPASSLTYDATPETVQSYREWLEDELEDKRRAALAGPMGSLSGEREDDDEAAPTDPPADEPTPGEPIDFAAAGREKRARRG